MPDKFEKEFSLSLFLNKKSSDGHYARGGGGKTLVAGPLKNNSFAASLD